MTLLLEIAEFIGITVMLLTALGIFQGFFQDDITEKRVDDDFEGDDYDEKN